MNRKYEYKFVRIGEGWFSKSEGKINDVVIENMMNWPPARRAYASERKFSPWNLSASGGSSERLFLRSE